MKKVFIACFFAIIMLMVPFTTVAQTSNISNIKNISNTKNTSTLDLEPPEFFITPDQYAEIIFYVVTNYVGENKDQAYAIINDIIGSDMRLDIIELAEAWDEYGYQIIDEDLDNPDLTIEDLRDLINQYQWAFNLFGGLLAVITGTIKNRLGWLHRVINDGYYLCYKGVTLAVNFVTDSIDALRALIKVVNLTLTIPKVFSQLMEDLFNKNYEDFKNLLSDFLGNYIVTLRDFIEAIWYLFLYLPDILEYLTFLGEFAWWLINPFEEKPWMKDIVVEGILLKNGFPLKGANVTCRGQSIETDSSGTFYFKFKPTLSEHSFPPNSYYGFHNCQIIVEKDDKILKQTLPVLSHVCSGGYMYWPFLIIKGRSRAADFRTVLMEKLNNLLKWIPILFPNFFRQISRIDTLSI